MSVVQIFGLTPLKGKMSIQGSRNAVLPMMAATMFHRGITVLTNVPVIRDVARMLDTLEFLDTRYYHKGDCLVIDAQNVAQTSIPGRYMTAMRSFIVILNALLGRMGEGRSYYPERYLIEARPIDLHLVILENLEAGISETEGRIRVACDEGLTGAGIHLPYPSVGATEQAILGSVLARDVTITHGAAREPGVSQLCRFLNNMGAVICGVGTGHLVVQGVEELHGSSFWAEGDRVIASTYAVAVTTVTGSVVLREIYPMGLEVPPEVLKQADMSVRIEKCCKQIWIGMKQCPGYLGIKTEPYPQFSTGLRSSFITLLASGEGTSIIEERVFEDRFVVIRPLTRVEASVKIEERKAMIEGHYLLKGTEISASDLGGGAAFTVAALAAQGEALTRDCHYIERGYEDICRDMAVPGVNIR